MIRFQEHVDVFRATLPLGATVENLPPPANFIDKHIFAQLKTLGLPPSENSDDATFLRRVTIDIAGRQRMLAQRVSKNTCLVSAGVTAQDAQTELALAAQNFGAALEALRNGAQAVGVRPPPTAAIADGLNSVYIKWESIAPIIAKASAGTPADAEQLAIIFHSGNQLTGGMNGVVGLYVEASKFGA